MAELKFQKLTLKQVVACSIFALATLPVLAHAQSEDDGFGLSELRAKLESNKGGGVAATVVGFKPVQVADPVNLDQEQARLKEAEAALLQELQARADGASKAPTQVAATTKQHEIDSILPDLPAAVPTGAPAIESVRPSQAAAPDPFGDEFEPIPTSRRGMVDTGASSSSSEADVTELTTTRTANIDLSRKLSSAENQLSQLRKELANTKNRLMFSETEVERLSRIIEERNRAGISKATGITPQQQAAIAARARMGTAPVAPAPAQRSAPVPQQSSDVPIATVISDKANLRTGPGQDNSPLMSVSRGTRLVVETKRGDWYRVVAPTGDRAWVSKDVLSFGTTLTNSTGSSVRNIESGASAESRKVLSGGDIN